MAALAVLQVMLLGLVALGANGRLDQPPPAIPLLLNSHATATAYVAKLLGAARPGEADRTLVATAYVYVQGCSTCSGSASKWDVMGGFQSLMADRGKPYGAAQRYRTGAPPAETASPEDVTKALDAGAPVIATFCYDPAATTPSLAAQRAGKCFTVVVIGVVSANGKNYLAARDGLAEGQTCEAAGDRVKPAEAGLPNAEGPWREPGSGLYRWDGDQTNIVLVLLQKPEAGK